MNDFDCRTNEEHCITCSDEAISVTVLGVDQEAGVAIVEIHDKIEEIDITLIGQVEPGDMLLVHGGVAISRLDEVCNE